MLTGQTDGAVDDDGPCSAFPPEPLAGTRGVGGENRTRTISLGIGALRGLRFSDGARLTLSGYVRTVADVGALSS